MSTFALGFNNICEMDYLPKDPAILVSSVNMLLRDEEFDTLESLCYNFGTEPTSSVTTNGFRRTSPRLWRYLKRCYNDYGEF